ncbi:hypothetical protein GCM10010460_06070 [Microbacterium terrae]|uniref:Uncharacterized protein n=2 Tax=Microbacterium terrae TaxID=69369 RepID=A0A0M2GUZ7_9MICO|nr:hypothetical protein RS81_03273 [Microbacterium terrae]GLJ97169.1 hypothetical protein GCM10017594_03660 [Microbacterium terrae]
MQAPNAASRGIRGLPLSALDVAASSVWGADDVPVSRAVVTWATTAAMLGEAAPGTLFVCRAHPFFASPTHWRTPGAMLGPAAAATWAFRSIGDEVLVRKRALLRDASSAIVWAPHLWDVGPDAAGCAFAGAAGLEPLVEHGIAIADVPGVGASGILDLLLPRWGASRALLMGNPPDAVGTIALHPGVASPTDIARILEVSLVDLIVCGEVVEWEGGPFLQDTNALGRRVGLATVGNAISEQTVNPLVADRVRATLGIDTVTTYALEDASWTPTRSSR